MKWPTRTMLAVAVAVAVAGLALRVFAQDVDLDRKYVNLGKAEYSPYLDRGYPDRVYFGDTHLHTSYSTDAGMLGNRLGPEEAYRFARGEEVISSTGVRARLQRPLDFLVVSDHAENLGLAPMISESNADLLKTEFGRAVHDLVKSGKGGDAYNLWGKYMLDRQDPLAKDNEDDHSAPCGREDDSGRALARARQVHRLHRLRVDRDAGGQ